MPRGWGWLISALLLAAPWLCEPVYAGSGLSARSDYLGNCAKCHHADRIGLTAPPLIPGLFSRAAINGTKEIIRNGLPSTGMPSFKNVLTGKQISDLAKYLDTPVDKAKLVWTKKDIVASAHPENSAKGKHPARFHGDLRDVTLVMERGTKSLVVLDGPELKEVARYYVGNVHGGPKFSYSLDNVYSLARDGLVTRFNVPTLAVKARVKAGIYSRAVAVSTDGRVVAVANHLPPNIVFFNNRLEPVGNISLPGKPGGFYTLPEKNRFILSFRDRPELWLIKPGGDFAVEKISLPEPFQDFSISPVGPYLLGAKRGSGWIYIYDYEKRKVLAKFPTSGLPHLGSAAFWKHKGELFAAVNHIKEPVATIISMDKRKVVARIPLPGAGFFVRTHYATPFLWIDSQTEKITLVNKNDFTTMRYLTPHPGAGAIHVEFTRHGKRALITIPKEKGEVVVYDSVSTARIKSIPFNHPVGKYNATNKTWPRQALEPAKKMMSQIAIEGEKVFENYCMGCHHQVYSAFGPSFTQIAMARSPGMIRRHIIAPKSSARRLGYKRNSMPRIKLDKKQMDAIVTYIESFADADTGDVNNGFHSSGN